MDVVPSDLLPTSVPAVRPSRLRTLGPGIALALVVAVAATALSRLVPGLSPLLIAIVVGVVLANTAGVPAATRPGIDLSAKMLLRAGIVLLGLQLVLADILGLGAPMLGAVVLIVTGGLVGTVLLGRALGVPPHLTLLIACGFSICGAAAVAGAAGALDPRDERRDDTITAVALVVLVGSAMILLVPFGASLMGLDDVHAGMWAGASIHEVAQVVAAGGIIGGGALAVAVVVKLSRVVLLAPVIAVLSLRERRRTPVRGGVADGARRPPVVPLFVLGFLVMVLVRSFVELPPVVLSVAAFAQTMLLAAAMFALGCGVRVRELRAVGARPFVLAAASTGLMSALALGGVALAA
ncbi:YeiH family protein [Brachybacterium sp. AOP25-B2-12]|uniref:YeiH family protein n=1 Tax=Brachybacterium sp. AOP25-B2-12 TaxID=3457710 RepID=UPI004033A8DA